MEESIPKPYLIFLFELYFIMFKHNNQDLETARQHIQALYQSNFRAPLHILRL